MADNIKEVKYQAEGLVCTGCVEDMQNILRDLDGIESAQVKFADGTIVIRYDPEEIDEAEIYEKVSSLGFKTNRLS